MATLEDKILGEKMQNYCSSSEDEGDRDDDASDRSEPKQSATVPADTKGATYSNEMESWSGSSANTGPKGVIKDWQRFKQLENEKNEAKERERLKLMKRLCITSKSKEEDQKQQKEDEQLEEELEAIFDLMGYRKQRMEEMMRMCKLQKTFGKVITLVNGDDFLKAVDEENKQATIVIHIYENSSTACRTMNKALETLAQEYVYVKFCRILSSAAGLSQKFKQSGLPALLVYKGGNLIGNFVRVSEDLGGDDFFPSDVESFLTEHAMLPDKTHVPVIVNNHKEDDSEDD